jgi:Sulfotransferase family
VARALRARAAPQNAYLDLGRSSASTVLVAGMQRSGTTWLAEEVLNHDNRYRMVFEPLHQWKSTVAPTGMAWAQYLAPDDDAPQFRDALDAVMQGRVRSTGTDRANHKRLARRRIVKCVTATNLMPWLRHRHPQMTTVHLIRHPFSVAHSLCRMRWRPPSSSPHAGDVDTDRLIAEAGLLEGPLHDMRDVVLDLRAQCTTPFALVVLRWCLENAVPLRTLQPSDLHHVLQYEHLVVDPKIALERLVELGIVTDVPAERFRRPSRTDFQQRVEGALAASEGEGALIAPWAGDTPRADLDLGMKILEAFGLHDVYGLDA